MGFGEPRSGVPAGGGRLELPPLPKIPGGLELNEATAEAEHVAGAGGCGIPQGGDFKEGVGAAGTHFQNFRVSCDSPDARSTAGASPAVPQFPHRS